LCFLPPACFYRAGAFFEVVFFPISSPRSPLRSAGPDCKDNPTFFSLLLFLRGSMIRGAFWRFPGAEFVSDHFCHALFSSAYVISLLVPQPGELHGHCPPCLPPPPQPVLEPEFGLKVSTQLGPDDVCQHMNSPSLTTASPFSSHGHFLEAPPGAVFVFPPLRSWYPGSFA